MSTSSVAAAVPTNSGEASQARSRSLSRARADRIFYTTAGILTIVLAFVGFQMFYLHGKAFPNREITPPIRCLVIAHGIMMAVWMVFSLVQPMLVAMGLRKLHMFTGRLGALVALLIVPLGLAVGIQSARVAPPGFSLMGFNAKEFMSVPVCSMIFFAIFVGIAIWKRRVPAIHRNAILTANLGILSAALNRIDVLNNLYVGTAWDRLFGPFFMTIVLAYLLLAFRTILIRGLDKWLTIGVVLVTLQGAGIVLLARTPVWNQIATALIGS